MMYIMSVQTHGGQDINVNIPLVQDFSVTTNLLGPNANGMNAIKANCESINHYPNQQFEPYIGQMKEFLFRNHLQHPVLLGNGASELIDLLIRILPHSSWSPGPSDVQYIEYERSCIVTGKTKVTEEKPVDNIRCIVNPTNPTGDYMSVDALKSYIERNTSDGSSVIVDESMQPWFGPSWREDSLVSQSEWVRSLLVARNIRVFIIHSWTKFFSCTGLRYGSLICPDTSTYDQLWRHKNPWSVNVLALQYIDECIRDEAYMNETWKRTGQYRKAQIDALRQKFPSWSFHGESFLPWLWVDTKDTDMACLVYSVCKLNGVPIRHGKMGYERPTFVRMAVRAPEAFEHVLKSLAIIPCERPSLLHVSIDPSIIVDFQEVDIQQIKIHENFIQERHETLLQYIRTQTNQIILPALIICAESNMLIDGHHRLSVLRVMGRTTAPCLRINYRHKDVLVHPYSDTSPSKNDVLDVNDLLPPKSTFHHILDKDGIKHHISVISPNISLSL